MSSTRRHATIILGLALALTIPSGAILAQDVERRPVEDPLFEVSSAVPADWQDLGNGIYARGTPPDDLALIAIQSAPATIDQVWSSLLPQLALEEVPEATGEHETDVFDWTLTAGGYTRKLPGHDEATQMFPGRFPLDRSPFGVLDMAGNMREFRSDFDPVSGRYLVRGGEESFYHPDQFRLAARRGALPTECNWDFGLRLIRRPRSH